MIPTIDWIFLVLAIVIAIIGWWLIVDVWG
jgi:hypothetical protein